MRLLIVAILGVAGFVLLVTRPSICRDAVAGTQVVRVCDPVAVTSAPVVLVVLVVCLLLLPELAELEIGGLVTLRRGCSAPADRRRRLWHTGLSSSSVLRGR